MLRVFLTLLRMILPLVVRVAQAALTTMLMSMTALGKSTWKEAPNIADFWILQAQKVGVDTRLLSRLRVVFEVVAFLSMVVGWCLLSYLTVAILNWFLFR
jgi:hypothetical protein